MRYFKKMVIISTSIRSVRKPAKWIDPMIIKDTPNNGHNKSRLLGFLVSKQPALTKGSTFVVAADQMPI